MNATTGRGKEQAKQVAVYVRDGFLECLEAPFVKVTTRVFNAAVRKLETEQDKYRLSRKSPPTRSYDVIDEPDSVYRGEVIVSEAEWISVRGARPEDVQTIATGLGLKHIVEAV